LREPLGRAYFDRKDMKQKKDDQSWSTLAGRRRGVIRAALVVLDSYRYNYHLSLLLVSIFQLNVNSPLVVQAVPDRILTKATSLN